MQPKEVINSKDGKVEDILSLIDKPACSVSFFKDIPSSFNSSFELLFKSLAPEEVIKALPKKIGEEILDNTLLQRAELKNINVKGRKFSTILIVPIDSNYILSFELSKPFNTDYQQVFQIIFDKSPLGILLVDTNNKFIAVNAAVTKMTGYTERELKEMTFIDITHPDDLDRNLPLTRKLYNEEIDTFTIQKRYIKKDGSIIWINLQTALAKDLNNEMIGGMGIVEDITDKLKIEKQRDELLHSLREKNKEIIDSLAYARTIQNTLLPSHEEFQKFFDKFFIYYHPKDVVGGDFYWIRSHGDRVYFAVADCTGHGVPGAFISLIGNYRLNLIFEKYKNESPAVLMEKLNNIIAYSFRNPFYQVSMHGMDMAMCCFDTKKRTLEFSGANNPLFIIRDGIEKSLGKYRNDDVYRFFSEDLMEIRGDKNAIGTYKDGLVFTNHKVNINPGDRIYLFSDGYADQFGGQKAKKLKIKEFKSHLLRLKDAPIEMQNYSLHSFRTGWQGALDQVDDICVLGIEF